MAHSAETKRKISLALIGHKHSPETLAKLRGRKRSPEACKRISDSMKGRTAWNKGLRAGNLYPNSGQFKVGHKLSTEIRAKMSASHKGKTWNAEEREKNRQGQFKRFKKIIPDYHPEIEDRQYRRKKRLVKNGGFHSKYEWEELKAKCDWTCKMCGRKEPEIKLTKDHILPVMHGGKDNIENIQPLCRSCNASKSTKILIENRVNSGEVQNGLS